MNMEDQGGSQSQSIRDRINAFNSAGKSAHLGRAPGIVPHSSVQRSHSFNPQSQNGTNNSPCKNIGNEPNIVNQDILPPTIESGINARMNSTRPAKPRLPPRRDSNQTQTTSALPDNGSGRIKAPPYGASILPALPSKRKPAGEGNNASPSHPDPKVQTSGSPVQSQRAPALPPRRSESQDQTRTLSDGLRGLKVDEHPTRSALSFGMNKAKDVNESAGSESIQNKTLPPPVPLNSRPDLSRILATKPKSVVSANQIGSSIASEEECLYCRDFSIIDAHAAKFPRHMISSLDELARQLASPFPSSTDKARAIFTWLHYNISYDVDAFFNGRIQPSTPASTLKSGLAVCEGYAGLYATLATKAGLESIVVGGHGKGFGFVHPTSNVRHNMPKDPSGHAWNAVKIDCSDDGQLQWKLIDPCWGAGHISGPGKPYTPKFSPNMFEMSNAEFTLRHYPANQSHFFFDQNSASPGESLEARRIWGQDAPPSWQHYIQGPLDGRVSLEVYGGLACDEKISESSFHPPQREISLAAVKSRGQDIIQFAFMRSCPHPQLVSTAPFVYILQIPTTMDGNGIISPGTGYLPFINVDEKGYQWRLDAPASRFRVSTTSEKQSISVFAVDTVDGKDARGMSVAEWKANWGRKGMGFQGLARWEIVA